jgi:hypothetical protein
VADLSDVFGAILGNATTAAREIGSAVASSAVVRIRTQFTPEIVLTPFAPGDDRPPSTAPNPFLDLLKPEVSVEVAGATHQVFAPYGRPKSNYFVLVLAGAGVLLAAGVLGIAVIARRL